MGRIDMEDEIIKISNRAFIAVALLLFLVCFLAYVGRKLDSNKKEIMRTLRVQTLLISHSHK